MSKKRGRAGLLTDINLRVFKHQKLDDACRDVAREAGMSNQERKKFLRDCRRSELLRR